MSSYRVLELFSHIVAFGCIIAGFYVFNHPRYPGASDTGAWIAVAFWVLSPILFCVGLLALLVRRQAEHALYFKELITARNEGRVADASPDASSLRKAA